MNSTVINRQIALGLIQPPDLEAADSVGSNLSLRPESLGVLARRDVLVSVFFAGIETYRRSTRILSP